MNNTTFGDASVGYYETVAGGAGAVSEGAGLIRDGSGAHVMCVCVMQGPGWDGRSGVHSHMTNTRITDPEILERRYTHTQKCCLLHVIAAIQF